MRENGDVAGWVVALPHGHAEGELYLKEQTIKVNGTVYHDHNWGNYPIYKMCRNWYWGRLHGKKYSIDYANTFANPVEAPDMGQLMIARGSDIVLSTTIMNTVLEDKVKEEKTGQEYAKKLMISGNVLDVDFRLDINSKTSARNNAAPQNSRLGSILFSFPGRLPFGYKT